MSNHSVPVFKVEQILPIPEADKLEIVFYKGFQFVVQKGLHPVGSLAVCIESDYVCPDNEMFKFLGSSKRIIPRRYLKKYWSDGLIMPAPEGAKEGDDLMEAWKIERYEPPIPKYLAMGEIACAPKIKFINYDVDGYKNFPEMLSFSNEWVATEKIHGMNCRFVYNEEKMHCGSHFQWKKDSEDCIFWKCLRQNPWIEKFCKEHPNWIVYGELYGHVQELHYGTKQDELRFAVFDIYKFVPSENGLDSYWEFCEYDEMKSFKDLQFVNELYRGSITKEKLEELAEGNSTIPGAEHFREGVVIRSIPEKHVARLPMSRLVLKYVSNAYLASKRKR